MAKKRDLIAAGGLPALSRLADKRLKRAEITKPIRGLNERIGELIGLYDTQKGAADSIGRTAVALQNWKKGTMPGFDDVALMAIQKNVRLDWVATGAGPMRRGDAEQLAPASDEYTYIPRYEVRAGAGIGQLVTSGEQSGALAFKTDWIRHRLRRNPAHLGIIEAVGDSMQPTINDGDVLLVDFNEKTVRGSAIYIIMAGDEALVKRVEIKIDGSLVVRSDNPAYEPTILPRDQIAELRVGGKVVWAGGMI